MTTKLKPQIYTTVAVDKYGRVYDLRYEHPSWEQAKQGNTMVNIVVNAYTKAVRRAGEEE